MNLNFYESRGYVLFIACHSKCIWFRGFDERVGLTPEKQVEFESAFSIITGVNIWSTNCSEFVWLTLIL